MTYLVGGVAGMYEIMKLVTL